jgi:hypothetical protein
MPVKIFTKIFPGWTGGNYIDIQSSVVPPPSTYLLDQFPGATLGYSVRKLRDAYTGYAFEVRRSSDNATTNIGFVGEDLDTTALTTFLGANTGYITRWYNQAASPITESDFRQSTALLQPTLTIDGGQYYVTWNASLQTKMNTLATNGLKAINANGSFSTFAMAIPTNNNTTQVLFQQDQSTTRVGQFTRFNNTGVSMAIAFPVGNVPAAIDAGPAYSAYTKYVHTTIRPTTSVQVFLNGVSNGATSVANGNYSSTTMGQAYAGTRVSGESFNGQNGELILYPSVMTADRAGIENNIRAYYGF